MRADNNYDIVYLSAYIRKGNGKVMEKKLKLPIGIENFEKIRTEGFYYVDKSGLIMELLENWGEVGGRLPGSSGADRSPGV